MAWTTPKTWASEPLVSIDLNTHVRDNLNHLHSRIENNTSYTADESGDYTTTSTSFVDVDGGNSEFELTINTEGGNVLVGFVGATSNNAGGDEGPYFNIEVDGSDYFADDGVAMVQNASGVSGYVRNSSFVCLIEGLSEDSHTFKLRWKTRSGNTATLYAGAGTTRKDVHPQFWVQEL